jgi:hypothetical protein
MVTLRTERSMLQRGLALSITALSVLGMAITAVAAPYVHKTMLQRLRGEVRGSTFVRAKQC